MSESKAVVRDNGPILVTGLQCIEDADGGKFDLAGKETIALCRCGATGNRPFCDGSHKACNFEAADRAAK